MSYQGESSNKYPQPPMGGQLGSKDQRGIAQIEQSLGEMNQVITDTFEHLFHLQSRLYPPQPHPVDQIATASTPSGVSGSLNQLHGRLRELRNLAAELLNG